jgi:hypothetical protein
MMKKKEEKYQHLIVDYLDGNLTLKEAEELRKMLEEEGYDLSRLDQMTELQTQMDGIGIPEPGAAMRDRFYAMLEEEKARMAKKRSLADGLIQNMRSLFSTGFLPKLSYASFILLAGFVLGHWILPDRQLQSETVMLMEEVQRMKEMMALALFEQPTASDRLKAVYYTSELSRPDDILMEALLKTLNQDPSVNVRLASLDALIPHMEDPEVRTGLIRSLGNQDSPLLQMAIAELMIKAQEKQAVPELEKLLQRKDLNGQVAEKLKEGIKVLT